MPSIKEQLTCTTIPDMSGIVVEAYCTRIPSVDTCHLYDRLRSNRS